MSFHEIGVVLWKSIKPLKSQNKKTLVGRKQASKMTTDAIYDTDKIKNITEDGNKDQAVNVRNRENKKRGNRKNKKR